MRDLFDVMGVARAYHLEVDALEARFRELSKRFHPDKFAKAPPRERLESVQKTTQLNDAYRVLKDAVKRAEYLAKLEGFDIGDERGSVKADPALFEEMMDVNEQLDDAKAAGEAARVQALTSEVQARRERAMRVVDEGFSAYEAGDRSRLPEVAQALIAMRYHRRFMEHAEGEEEDI